jgi:hypothetical protein
MGGRGGAVGQLVSFVEVAVPSVRGPLEIRGQKVSEEVARLREEAERVQAALVAAKGALARLAGARETVSEVLGEQPGRDAELRPARPQQVEHLGRFSSRTRTCG